MQSLCDLTSGDMDKNYIHPSEVAAVFKEAFITPVMKKPGLDAADTSSYRPISNLPVVKAPGTSRSPPTDGVPVVR